MDIQTRAEQLSDNIGQWANKKSTDINDWAKRANETHDKFVEKATPYAIVAKSVLTKTVDVTSEFITSNLDRALGVGIVIDGFVGTITSLTAAGELAIPTNTAMTEVARELFGNGPKLVSILSASGSAATFAFLARVGMNVTAKSPDLLDMDKDVKFRDNK